MQVVCGNCQLNFQAPDGATGLVCPICRSPLQPAQAAADTAATKKILEWDGGTLDDLIAIVSGPAWAVRVEVMPPGSDIPAGEVHLLAGGVSDAIAPGVSPNDALDFLRGVVPARFRIEPRLPNPADGDLTYPGAESGTLDARPLAHLMRYCEQYVITCAIEVWRGNENARVDYRKGEISGVTVGGIDAPERLAEVMRWASGNYRLVVPRLSLSDLAPKGAPAAKPAARAEVPAAPAMPPPTPGSARPTPAPAPANRTIFGMPAADLAAMRAAVEAADITASAARPSSPAVAAAPAAPAPAPAPAAAPAMDRASGTRTMFGVPAPVIPAGESGPAPVVAPPKSKKQVRAEAAAAAAQAKQDRKTGARKTLVPPPEIVPPAPNALDAAAAFAAVDDAAAGQGPGAVTHAGFSSASAVSSAPALAPAPVSAPASSAGAETVRRVPVQEDETSRMVSRPPAPRETPIWTYVGVGFTFGLALLGIYRLVGMLAH